MLEKPSKRTEIDDASRIDHLLGLLGDLSKYDPSPTLRDQLGALAARRLGENLAISSRPHKTDHKIHDWLRPALSATLCVAVGLIVALVIRLRGHVTAPVDTTAKVSHPAVPMEPNPHVGPATRLVASKYSKFNHSHPAAVSPIGTRQMTMRLPYSNSAIETGTDATIRVSISQSELLSLGFPINTTVQDRRILAQLTLGDDGLPRAISLPLPLQVVKEKK
jgi:hypothetical protein